MIALWKKQLILDRLKEENEGVLDYLTPDDVIIEPFGAKSQLDSEQYRDELGSTRSLPKPSMINTRYFRGRFKWEINNPNTTAFPNSYCGYEYYNFQKYKITGKPERYVIGEFIIAAYINKLEDFFRYQTDIWPNNNKPDTGYNSDAYFFTNALFMDTTVLKGRDFDRLTDNEILGLLPPSLRLDMNEVKTLKVEKLKRKEGGSYIDGVISYHSFDYIKVTVTLKISDIETSIYVDYKSPDSKSNMFTFYIVNKNIYVNAKTFYYGGNTNNLKLTLGKDFFMSGLDTNKENLNYSTISLMLDHNDSPEFATLQYDYYYDFFPRRYDPKYTYLNEFKPEIQKIIIDTLTRFHHWKWGTQNQPGNYSEQPSSHNLFNAEITVADKTPYKYKDAKTGRVSVFVSPSSVNTFIKYFTINREPDEKTNCYVSLSILPDPKYNTGYEGEITIYLFANLFKFDEGIR